MAKKRDSLSAHHAQQNALHLNGKVCIGNAVLNMVKVRHIKQMLLAGYTRLECAELYGVGKETIARIDRGESWGHVRVEGEPHRPVVDVPIPESPGRVPVDQLGGYRLTKEAEQASIDRVLAKAGKPPLAQTPLVEDPNETAKRLLLGSVGGLAGASDTNEAPENLDELP